MTTHYELGGRFTSKKTCPLIMVNKGPIGGIEIFARDEKAGDYIQVFETAPTIFVDNEPQAWQSGNFGDIESGRHFGSMAYRFINKGR